MCVRERVAVAEVRVQAVSAASALKMKGENVGELGIAKLGF